MCQFFSLVSNGKGKTYYFNWELRQKCLSKELNYDPDSHTSIADYFGFVGKKEDKLNKYEYNPLTKKFVVDQLNTTDDSESVEKFCNNLDFKDIVPALTIKPIIHPFKVTPPAEITEKHLELLRQWASIRVSVSASVWASVSAVSASAWASVRDSVSAVWSSVWDSVGADWACVWAYIGSFFEFNNWEGIEHKQGEYPFAPLVELWEVGLVPSYDGKVWRLHGGEEADILWEGKI